MTQGFLQPKGSIKKQDIGPMVQQWAKEQAQGQLNSTPEVNPLKDTVQDLLLKNLQKDITIPKTYTTIQDIFNANEGDRFNALADWFQSPQFNRFTGGDYTFDPESGRMMSTGERIARRQEAQLKAEQEKALEAQKQQLGIAEGLNKEFNEMDIADKKLKADAEQFAQSLALERERLEETKRHNRASEANGLGVLGARLGATAAEGLSGTYQGIKQMTDLKGMINQLPGRITTPGIAQLSAMNPLDTDAQTFNQYVKTYKQVIGKGLEGGVLRKEDEYKYDQIIPKVGDTKAVLRKKAEQLQRMLENKYRTDKDFYNMAGYNTRNFPNLIEEGEIQSVAPNIDLNAIEKELRRRGIK